MMKRTGFDRGGKKTGKKEIRRKWRGLARTIQLPYWHNEYGGEKKKIKKKNKKARSRRPNKITSGVSL